MNPALAARNLGLACLLGCAAGLWYGIFRPVRPRWFSDLLFVTVLFWLWLVLSFDVCDGDLRFGYTAAFLLCTFLFDRTAGRLLAPLFDGFWRLVYRFLGFFLYPFREILKKIRKIAKKYLHCGKNRVQ